MDQIAGLLDWLVNTPTPGTASFASAPSAVSAPHSTAKFKELQTFNGKLDQVCYFLDKCNTGVKLQFLSLLTDHN
jgi:hypothetical protein